MADIQANIGINLDTSRALAQLKNLQRQISVFNAEIARGGGKAATAAAGMQQELANSINATGQFSASMTTVRSTTDSFTNALEKNKLSLGQTFRYAGAASKKFSHLFTSEFNTIEKVARERVKTIQTQYIKMGRDANGAIKSIAIRPLSLDMNNLATQTAMAAQKQQILNQLLRQGSTNLLNWGKNTQWAGRQLMVGFTLPLALFGAAASKSFMELEEQAIRFKRVYGDLFTTPQQADQAFADMQRLGQEFTKYGVAVEKTIGLAASVAQMGKTGAELTAQVTEATRLAVLGGMEQEDALNTTISLTNAFGIAAEDLTSKINFLNAAENQTILSIQDFNEAVPRAGSVVAQLGGDVEDLAFFLTAMREGGIEASQGANALKTSLGRLVNPTRRAREELAAYGIDVVGIVERNAGNLRQTVLDLGMALDRLDPLEKSRAIERLFGKFQFARMSALFNNIMDEGSQAAAVLDLINTSAGDLATIAGRELGRVEQSAATKFRSAIEEFQAALAPVGESFLKLVTPIIEFGTKVLNAFNNLNDGTKAFVVGLVATAGAVGPVLLMTVGLLANGIANIMKMFLGLQTVFQRIRGGTKDVADQTEYMTQQQLEAAAAAASLNQSHSTLKQTFTSELLAVNNLSAAYERMTAAQRNSLGIPPIISTTASNPGFAKGRIVPGYKDGVVMVPGPKGAGDIQPAMLAPGEAVIPAAMAEKYGPLINAMIAGNIPGYMAGKTKKAKTSNSSPKKSSISVGESSYELATSSGTAEKIAIFAQMVVDSVENGSDIVAEAFARMADDTGVSVSSFLREMEVVSADLYGNSPDTVRKTVGKDVEYKASAAGVKNLPQQLASSRGQSGVEEYERSVAARDESLKALEEHYRQAGKTEEEIQKLLASRSQIVRAHIVEVDNIEKMFREGWDPDLWVAQTESENQLSNTLENSPKTRKEYTRHLEALVTDEKIRAEIIRKITNNIALTEDELEIQAQVLKNMLADAETMAKTASGKPINVSDNFESQAVGTIGAAKGRKKAGPASPGVGTRTTVEVSEAQNRLSQARTRNVSGEIMSVAQAEAKNIARVARKGAKLIVKTISKAIKEELSKGFQSASPSKVTKQEMKNAVDGAVRAVREGQDDMQQAGLQLAEAADRGFNNFGASGTSSRTRGAPSRTRTAGEFTTPGQPPVFDIAGGKEIQAAQEQLAVSTRMSSQNIGNLAVSAINGANKIGSIGIAVSSLAGGLTMVEGPLGEFARKLFPITGIITGLSFAMNYLNAETVRHNISNAASRIAEERKTVATIINTRATQAETVAKTVNAGATSVVTGTVKTVGTGFRNLGTRIVGLGRSVGSAALGLLGIPAPVALVVAGLALLAGGIYLLYKVAKDQEAKINGLGDAANMSAERLNNLNEALGIQGSGARAASIEGAQSSLSTAGTFEEQKEIVNTKAKFLELRETNKEFKAEWKGTVAALKSGSDEIAKSTLEMLAVQLQTEGYTEEQVAGVVMALQELSGKTDVEIDFASIDINTQTGAIDAAAEKFVNSVEDSVGRYNAYSTINFDQAALDNFGATLASSIINLNAQFDAGLIDLKQYESQLEFIRLKIEQIANDGPNGLANAKAAVEAMVEDLKELGFEGIEEDTSGLIEIGTAESLGAATSVAQATAAGVPVDPEDIALMEAGFADGASERSLINAQRLKKGYDDLTESIKDKTRADQEQEKINEQIKDLPGDISAQTDALNNQIDTFSEVYDEVENNVNIKNKLAVAEKIAGDEISRLAYEQAVADGTTQEFLQSIDDQIEAEKELKAVMDLQALRDQVAQQKQQNAVTEGLGTALGDATEAQEIMNNAQYSGILMGALLKAGFDATTGSAEDLAAAMANEDVLATIALIREAMSLAGSAPKAGGGGGTPKSFLDDIVKGLRDVASGQTKVTEGFKSSLRALVAFSKAGVKGLNGLSSQLRKAGVTGTFAEKILGMDPKDWERQKRELFNFDAAGNITGLTAAGEAVQEALGVIEIGKFIDEQQNLTVSVGEQIEALNRLTGAGASYEAAYAAVQNAAFASAVATAKSTELITAAAQEAMAAMAKMKELEEIDEEEERRKRISEAIREQNKEFSNQAKILDHINKSNYSEAQINEILNNKDLQSLVLEPSIDPGALSTALANAQKQADLELRIKKLTVEGQEDIFQEGVSNAMSAFGALEEEIDIEFRAKIKDDGSLVQDAERQIALIDFELDDYQAGLDEIDRLEQDINDVYDKRIEALDEVATLNEDIARSQESQLEIADALSKGDIAAAARAAQQSRQVQQESAREAQQRMLEEQRASEIARLRSSGGMTREDLQDRIRDLEEQIFNIEEKTLEPAQERIRLAEITRDDRVADLQVLGKTREEWDKISNSVDVAQANGWRFADAMQEALNIVEKLVNSLTNRPAPPSPPAPAAPAPAPQRSSGGSSAPAPAVAPTPPPTSTRQSTEKIVTTYTAAEKAASAAVQKVVSAQKAVTQASSPYASAALATAKQNLKVVEGAVGKSVSQMTAAQRKAIGLPYAYGGMVGRARSGPPQQYFGGGKVNGPGTEKSDSIPALLSNGEYVIRASSVRLLGKDFLDKLNGGKVVSDEKNGLPAFKGGGIAKAAPKKYTPPVSIRQAERAASKPAPKPKPSLPPSRTVATPAPATRRPSSASASRTSQPVAPQPTINKLLNTKSTAAATSGILADVTGGRTGSPDRIEARIEAVKPFITEDIAKYIQEYVQPAAPAWDGRVDVPQPGSPYFNQEVYLKNLPLNEPYSYSTPGTQAVMQPSTMEPGTRALNKAPALKDLLAGIGEFFLPITMSQVGQGGPSSVAPIRRGATDNSLVDDLLGMPFAGDIALYAGGSALGAGLGFGAGKLLQSLRGIAPGAIRPSGNTIVSPNATTIRQQQEAIAAETARIIDDKVAEGVATGHIPNWTESGGIRDRFAIALYKRALVESDRLSSGPIMTPGQEVLDNTTHISNLSPAGLLGVAKAHVSNKSLDEIVSPYMVRTNNQRTFIASTNPIENVLAKLGITTRAKREIEDNLRFLNTAPDFMTDPENAAILRNMISPQLGAYPKFVTGRQSSAFVSGGGTSETLRKIGGIGGMSGSTRLGPLSAFMGKQATREDTFTLGHENAHIIQKLYERLGLRSPSLPSPRDFNYGPFSNARLESGARLTDSLYEQAMGRTGLVRPYFPPELTLDNLVSMSLNSNTPAGRRALESFAKDYVVPNAPRGFQFNANWFEEYFAGISSSTIKTPHSINEMGETLKIAQSLRKAGLTNQTQPNERAGAMMRLVWNEISENGMVRPGDELMAQQLAFTKIISKEANKRSNRQKKTRSLSPSLAPRQSSEFIQGSSLTRLKNAPKDVEYEPGTQMMVSSFAENASGKKFFVKGHLHESWERGEPDTVGSSFINEFLAGRIGNYIGANTPQSYIVKRSAGDITVGGNMKSDLAQPFEIATSVVPSSHSLDPEYMKALVLTSDNPYKTVEELFDGFVDYSRTTPALNAVMGNSDLHYNNILWSNATKKFNQIDFNEAKPNSLKMAPGIPGTSPNVRNALVIAKSSMALVRESLNDAVGAALENQLLTQSQQLALIGKMNASGFKLTANKNATDPLSDTVLDITTTQDYTKLFEKIASSDGENYIPRALEGEWRGIKGGTRVVDPWVLKTIQERAEVLSEFGRVPLDVGDYGMMAQRMAIRGKGFMAGGFVKSRNTDNIPAMLSAGEYVVKRSAVQSFGADNLEKINNGTYNDGSVYNYNLAVNVKSDADPNKIARTVITNIKGIENQRVRGNKL